MNISHVIPEPTHYDLEIRVTVEQAKVLHTLFSSPEPITERARRILVSSKIDDMFFLAHVSTFQEREAFRIKPNP